MTEQEAEDQWMLRYYIPTEKCQECHRYFLNYKDSPISYNETLTKLKEHLFHEHKIDHNSVHNIEYDVNEKKIPVRRFIRKCYTKLKGDLAKCNCCFAIISYKTGNYRFLHEHLICKHEDKLTEIEKNDKKIQWYWDYVTRKDKAHAKCNICNRTIGIYPISSVSYHLKIHKKSDPSDWDSDRDYPDGDTDMGTSLKRAKRQEDINIVRNSPRNRTIIMAEEEAGNEWVLLYYVPTLMCHKCNVSFWSDTDNILSYKETLIKLKEHLLHDHNIEHDFVHNIQRDVNKEKIPVRRFIREHYSKLIGDMAKCNYCFVVINYSNMNYNLLHNHLISKHKDKLTETEKNEERLHWCWDYYRIKNFTINEKMRVKCNICKKILIAYSVGYLTMHLKIHNRITGASSSSDMDDMDSDINMVTPAVEVIRQEASSKNMYEMTQETSQGTNQGTNQGTTQGTSQGTSSNKKTVPNSISDTDNNIDMGTPTKGAKQLDDTDSPRHRMDIMAEAGCPSEDEWMLQYYIPTLMCQECHEPILNNKASSSSYKETLTKLKEHLIHEHKIDHDSVHNIEHDVIKDMIPVRSFIRKHYSKLNGYAAKCNHCFRVINYTVLHSVLHKHLKYKHEEKLTETERNEERVLWYWDYVTIKDEMLAICNYCNAAYKINSLKNLPHHISVHKKTDPRSYSDTDDTDGNTGMKHQEDTNSLRSRTDIMAEQEAEDKWVLQYYIPTLMCQECHDHFLNDKANSSSFKETLTKLREHLFEEHNIKQDSVPNIEYNLKEKLPIRRFIRKRYLKLKGDLASCNYCFGLISFKNKNYNFLHKHLLCKHEDKLTVINKNETKISWYWDYFKKGERNGICTICNRGISLGGIANHMKGHKETYEVLNSSSDIDDPNSDPDDPNSNTDNTNNGTNMDTLTKEAEHQKDTHSPRPRTDVMVEQEAEDKETHEVPSSSSDPDGTNSDTDNANSDTYDTNSDTDDANSDTDDTNALQIQCSDTDMDTLTKEAEHREGTNSPPLRTDIMAEQEAEDEGLLKYYIPTLMCQECHDHFLNDKASTLSFKETLTKLGEHLVCEHNIKQDSVHNIEYDVNKEKIPVRRFIQEHYSKLKKDVAECNHCFALISYKNRNYSILHEHLIRKHEDKLTEIEKNETKFLWFWDYFTIDDTSLAKCNTCNTTFYALTPAFFTDHVRTHEKTVRSSSNDTNSNTDMNMPTKEAICQEDKELRHRTNIMAEQEAGDEWMLQYYIPTLMCQECHDPFLNNKTYSLSYKETLTKLGEHLVCEHNIKQDFVHDIEYDVNKKKIPVRRFIRGHYSKLKGDAAKCNYCFIVICYKNAHNILHEHLKCKHKDKLTEIEKSETNFHWFWDYFTINDKAYAKCHKCNIQFYALTPAFLTDHLKTHEKTDPSSSSDTSDTDNDTEMDTPMREAKR